MPSAIPALSAAIVLAGTLFGWNPFWPAPELTPSEAAALRDPATVLNLVASGQSLNDRYLVRRGLILDWALQLTPLEAAVTTRDARLFRLLLESGAALEGQDRVRMACFARESGAGGIERLIVAATHDPIDCSTVKVSAEILGKSKD